MTDGYPYLIKSTWELPRSLGDGPGRHSIHKLDPAEPRVSIYCLGNLLVGGGYSHEEDPVPVASFVRATYEGFPPRWVEADHYPTADGTGFWIGLRGQHLVGDKYVNARDTSAIYDPNFRIRYPLECNTCGDKYDRRADNIQPALDAAYSNGFLELSLRSFRSLGTMA